MRRKGGRATTEDELRLWRAVMRDAEPLARPEAAAPEAPPEPAKTLRAPEAAPSPAPKILPPPSDFAALLGSAARPGAPRKLAPAAPFVAPLGPSTPELNRRTAERLKKGDKRPEARVDLHGMTLERAHAALIWFILESRRSGRRLVLVVTGKGGDYQARASGLEGPRRGSLRESAPRWLGSPPLNAHVGGVYQAHERHGGAGALYVYLRK